MVVYIVYAQILGCGFRTVILAARQTAEKVSSLLSNVLKDILAFLLLCWISCWPKIEYALTLLIPSERSVLYPVS
jgi:hypothetical protein